jgi:hypothetical protein
MRLVSSLVALVALVVVLPMDSASQASSSGASSTGAGPTPTTFCERNPHTCGARGELWEAMVRKARGTQALAQGGWTHVQATETWQSLVVSFRSVGRMEHAHAALTAEQVEASFAGANRWRTVR